MSEFIFFINYTSDREHNQSTSTWLRLLTRLALSEKWGKRSLSTRKSRTQPK